MRATGKNPETPILSLRRSTWLLDGVWGNFGGSLAVQGITILGDARKCPLQFRIHAGFNRGTSPLAGEPNKLETVYQIAPGQRLLLGSGQSIAISIRTETDTP